MNLQETYIAQMLRGGNYFESYHRNTSAESLADYILEITGKLVEGSEERGKKQSECWRCQGTGWSGYTTPCHECGTFNNEFVEDQGAGPP